MRARGGVHWAGVVGALATLTGILVYRVYGGNELMGYAAAWLVLTACAAVFVPLAGLAFHWLDVSRGQPE